MNKVNIILLSLISVSAISAEHPSKSDYLWARFYPGSYVGNTQVALYEKVAIGIAKKMLARRKQPDVFVDYFPNLGPAIEVRDDKKVQSSHESNLKWQPVFSVNKAIPVVEGRKYKDELVVTDHTILGGSILTPEDVKDLETLIISHKALETELVGSNWSPDAQELVKGEFFRTMNDQSEMPKDHIDKLIVSHEETVLKRSFRSKIAVGVIAVAAGVGLTVFVKKHKEQQQNNELQPEPIK